MLDMTVVVRAMKGRNKDTDLADFCVSDGCTNVLHEKNLVLQ